MAKRLRPMFCDLLNLPRGKYVPAGETKVGFARGVFGTTYDRDLIPAPGAGMYDGLPDMELHLTEKRKGWQVGTEVWLGELHADGRPFALCPRGALQRAISAWDADGLTPMVGLELEAYLFQRDEDGAYRPYGTPGAFVYGTGSHNDPKGVMDAIWEKAYKADLPIESMNGEYDNGQFELTLVFADAMKACDDAFLLRTLAREEAYKHGLLLTFLPKPIPDRGGSGMHVNFSFTDKKEKNVIAPDGDLSYLAKRCMAGLIHHHEGLAGLLANTVNSYDRLNPGAMSGYWANWGYDHRGVTVRIPHARGKGTRVEHRMADGAANPYLLQAVIIAAGLDGLATQADPGKRLDIDMYAEGHKLRGVQKLPLNLMDALRAFDKNKALK